jgi:hypothetical protein|tara:strand:- start:1347 stop:1823 length:477 start_codon:yes stop_codon:yes gene_type:complete
MMIITDEQIKQDWYDDLAKQYDERVIALAHYNAGSFGFADYEEAQDNIDSEDYLVYTDEEADEAVRDYIEESVWAFTPSFLRAHTGVTIEAIAKLQEMCEDANDPLKAMIKDFDHFVEDAVSCDGRGHFLAPYDHEENEITFNVMCYSSTTYYIYRRN